MTFDPFHSSNAVNTIFMSASAVQIYAPFGHRLSESSEVIWLLLWFDKKRSFEYGASSTC